TSPASQPFVRTGTARATSAASRACMYIAPAFPHAFARPRSHARSAASAALCTSRTTPTPQMYRTESAKQPALAPPSHARAKSAVDSSLPFTSRHSPSSSASDRFGAPTFVPLDALAAPAVGDAAAVGGRDAAGGGDPAHPTTDIETSKATFRRRVIP